MGPTRLPQEDIAEPAGGEAGGKGKQVCLQTFSCNFEGECTQLIVCGTERGALYPSFFAGHEA